MNGKFYKSSWAVLTVVIIIIAVVSLALLFSTNLSPLFLHYPHNLLSHHSRAKLLNDYWHLLAYLQFPWESKLHLEVLPMTGKTVLHFKDVRQIFLVNEFTAVLFSGLASYLLLKQKQPFQLFRVKELLKAALLAGILVSWLPIINFNDWFIKLHRLLFRNHYWILNPTDDPIILMLPSSFFIKVFLLMFGISLLILFSLIAWLKFRTDETNNCRN